MPNKVAVSLFDESGNMLRPWAEAGYECHMFDLVNADHKIGKWMQWHHADLDDSYWSEFILDLRPSIIFAFPPCDDMAVCGAKHFAAKLKRDPTCQVTAFRRARLAAALADEIGCPYMVENPVSILSTLWRKPNHTFDPYEYGGYLPANDEHPRFPNIIPPRDAYNKKTCLWTGNGFVMPPAKPVPLVSEANPGWKRLGGKSARTKQIRSETPRGFAIAVKEANHGQL